DRELAGQRSAQRVDLELALGLDRGEFAAAQLRAEAEPLTHAIEADDGPVPHVAEPDAAVLDLETPDQERDITDRRGPGGLLVGDRSLEIWLAAAILEEHARVLDHDGIHDDLPPQEREQAGLQQDPSDRREGRRVRFGAGD